MTLLDDIIDGSTDGSVATTDLLRKVQIVAHRLGATEIVEWVKQELGGYDHAAELPPYRVQSTNVMGTFAGPMRSFMPVPLTVMPTGMRELWTVELREPVMELQSLSEGDGDPSREWPTSEVQRYETSGVYTIQFHTLWSAQNVITRSSLRGVVDTVRSKAMEFALELQIDFPDAGTLGGPNVSGELALAQTVYNITNNITGHGTNIATGSNIKQRSSVREGDAVALKSELVALGLSPSDAEAFVAAVKQDGDIDGPNVKSFLDKVGAGAITVAGSLASDVAAGVLLEFAKGFLGL